MTPAANLFFFYYLSFTNTQVLQGGWEGLVLSPFARTAPKLSATRPTHVQCEFGGASIYSSAQAWSQDRICIRSSLKLRQTQRFTRARLISNLIVLLPAVTLDVEDLIEKVLRCHMGGEWGEQCRPSVHGGLALCAGRTCKQLSIPGSRPGVHTSAFVGHRLDAAAEYSSVVPLFD